MHSGPGIAVPQGRRVLQVSRSVIEGGFDYHAEIARGFVDLGADVVTVFQRGRMAPARKAAFPGAVMCLEAERRRVYKRSLGLAWALWRTIRRRPYDLAVCHHLTPARAVGYLLRARRVRRAQLVVHDYDYFDASDKHGRYRNAFLASAMRGSWGVIGVSRAICANVRAQVPAVTEDRCQVIHNAVDLEGLEKAAVTREQARSVLGLDPAAFVIGTVGRLVEFKAHDDLIAAFSRVYSEMPQAHLSIVGRGPLEMELRAQVRALGLEHRVSIHGFVDNAARYMSAFDVFVLPSHKEPFGLVLLEAMAARLPIIASDSGATGEILPAEGVLFRDGDRSALSLCLRDLYEASAGVRRAMGEAGHRRAHDAFSLEGYRAAYGSLLSRAAIRE